MSTPLYVTGFGRSFRARDIAEVFETSVGRVKDVELPPLTGRTKPFAIVELFNTRDTKLAIEQLHQQSFKGTRYFVTYSNRGRRLDRAVRSPDGPTSDVARSRTARIEYNPLRSSAPIGSRITELPNESGSETVERYARPRRSPSVAQSRSPSRSRSSVSCCSSKTGTRSQSRSRSHSRSRSWSRSRSPSPRRQYGGSLSPNKVPAGSSDRVSLSPLRPATERTPLKTFELDGLIWEI